MRNPRSHAGLPHIQVEKIKKREGLDMYKDRIEKEETFEVTESEILPKEANLVPLGKYNSVLKFVKNMRGDEKDLSGRLFVAGLLNDKVGDMAIKLLEQDKETLKESNEIRDKNMAVFRNLAQNKEVSEEERMAAMQHLANSEERFDEMQKAEGKKQIAKIDTIFKYGLTAIGLVVATGAYTALTDSKDKN